jgi:ferric-dicitrate binding protein FerR (iron transport regulator)
VSPAPGQRAAQPAVRAMTSTQRALGRAAQSTAGGLTAALGLGWVDGQHFQVDLSAPPGQQARLAALACGCTGRCRGDCPEADEGQEETDMHERQG